MKEKVAAAASGTLPVLDGMMADELDHANWFGDDMWEEEICDDLIFLGEFGDELGPLVF